MKIKCSLVCLILAGLLMVGCQQEPLAPVSDNGLEQNLAKRHLLAENMDGNLTVMTRNIYVGANFDAVLMASDPNQIPLLVLQVFQDLLSTDIYTRAQALADEIAINQPQMIGLQEVSLIRYQSPGDFVTGENTPAVYEMFNYLEILMEALEQRDLNYRVAGIVENFDVELPMVVSADPLMFDDVRLTDYDVVLVRDDVQTFRVKADNYKASYDVPVNEQVSLTVKRGYVIVDVGVYGKKYRFANTHLEDPSTNPQLEFIQFAQAQELVKKLDNQAHPVILVGDFNSRAPSGMTYQYLLSENYVDVWNINQMTDNPMGYTYGHDESLRVPDDAFYERIDYIFLRNKVHPDWLGPVNAWVTGEDIDVFNTYGLWPSDHGGIVAAFILPKWNREYAWGKN